MTRNKISMRGASRGREPVGVMKPGYLYVLVLVHPSDRGHTLPGYEFQVVSMLCGLEILMGF